MDRNKKLKISVCMLLMVFAVNVCAPVVSVADDNSNKPRVVVSMGDSYSSGEGLDPFYGNSDPNSGAEFTEWLAHQSKYSWPGMLELPEGKLSDYKAKTYPEYTYNPNEKIQWYFVASSGAETKDVVGDKENGGRGQKKDYSISKDSIGFKGEIHTQYLRPQINVLHYLKDKGVAPDYITLTLGGNDIGFVDIINTACSKSSYLNSNYIRGELTSAALKLLSKTKKDLYDTYHEIYKAGTVGSKKPCILVAGYPRLLDPKGKGLLISKVEATWINEKVTFFNEQIEDVVNTCKREGMNIVFVDVEKEFGDHGAYAYDAWINKVILMPRDSDINKYVFVEKQGKYKADNLASARSMHPNKKGASAYAKCVQNQIMELEKWSAKIPNKDIEGGARAIESKLPKSPEITKDTSDNEPWRKAYIDFLTTDEDVAPYEDEYGICTKYTLIYLDDDSIPEIFVDTGFEAGGEYILTYYNGKVIKESLSRTGSEYIERSGLVYTNTGHMEYYPLTITKLENGVFTVIGKGVSYISEEDYKKRAEDENYHPSLTYEWEGKKVTEDQYNAKVAELYDLNKSKVPDNYYTYDEFVKLLKSGK